MGYTGDKLKRYYSWKALRSRDRSNIDPVWGDFEKYLADTGYPESNQYMVRKDTQEPWGPNNFEWKTRSGLTAVNNAEYQKKWREQNPGYHRGMRYQRKYGISLKEYKEMLITQDGKCAICDNHESQSQQGTVRQLAVDHNHDTKELRQLLDNKCNAILGHAKDSGELLAKCILYLAKHSPDPIKFLTKALKPIHNFLEKHAI